MTTFDEREAAFETKFAREAELEFLAQATRNKLVAYWAASLMGMSAEEAAGYAKQIIHVDFINPGTEAVVAQLVTDLAGKMGEADVQAKMGEYLSIARQKVRGEAD